MKRLRKRPILIIFKNKVMRDTVYANKSNLRKLDDRHGKLFLNENLPKNLKILLGKANKIRKEKNYKFIWTKNGTILVRKTDNCNVISISRPSDIEKIV